MAGCVASLNLSLKLGNPTSVSGFLLFVLQFPFNLPFTCGLLERCVFHQTFICSPVYLSVCAFMASGTDVMPGRAVKPMYMNSPSSSVSYFLVIHKSFQNTIVRTLMVFGGKPEPAEHCLLIFRTLASRQLL